MDVQDINTNVDVDSDGTGHCWDAYGDLDETFTHDLSEDEIKEFHDIQLRYYQFLRRMQFGD